MGNLVFVFIIAAIAFWLGRKTKPIPSNFPETSAFSATQSVTPEAPAEPIPMNILRLLMLIFIAGWMVAWSIGIFMAMRVFLGSLGEGFITVFMGGWLLAAFAGWGFAALTIHKLLTGKPIAGRNGQQY